MYDELTIVVRKDTATGGFSKSYVDLENEPDNGSVLSLLQTMWRKEFPSPVKEGVHLLMLKIVC